MVDKDALIRLPAVPTLSSILPAGTEGGKEFARIIDLLLFHEARREGKTFNPFNDSAGDYASLDSFSSGIRTNGRTGYQYKFFPSPLSSSHRAEIKKSLFSADKAKATSDIDRWIIVTPDDLTQSGTRKEGGDVAWFEELRLETPHIEIEHFGHTKLQSLFLQSPHLALYYYPEIVRGGRASRKSLEGIREGYNAALRERNGRIEFVGMSVYKEEATRGVPLEQIYIPLSVVGEEQDDSEDSYPRQNPLDLLSPGSRSVFLGDPGSGKSTLLSFLALSGISAPVQERFSLKKDGRIPIVVTLRRYADELKTRSNVSLLDYIIESVRADFSLNTADEDFFEFYLEAGKAVIFFDGLDELPNSQFKSIVKDRIRTFGAVYPLVSIVVTSRIVGYDGVVRFDSAFQHFRMARLRSFEIRSFIEDWYRIRVDSAVERQANVDDLTRIIQNPDSTAIRDLARNPLLLTIVALVHRIDAVLPDERVVLYQKCTETLLNTWYRWKFKDEDEKSKGKIERRNRKRIEAIAFWMQCRSVNAEQGRAVVSKDEIHLFLTGIIVDKEFIDLDDAKDEAAEFLDFIKSRTGLLIEAGDELYSFLHLTFQEYLAATYLLYRGEFEGVPKIWDMVGNFVGNPRWHEVIRLLIASLKSEEGQEFFLDKISLIDDGVIALQNSLLLGGLLLDGIDPVERQSLKVMRRVFSCAFSASNFEDLPPLERVFRSWMLKRDENRGEAWQVFQNFAEEVAPGDQVRYVLTGLALGIDEGILLSGLIETAHIPSLTGPDSVSGRLLKGLDISRRRLRESHNVCDRLAIESPEGNLASALLQPVLLTVDETFGWQRLFQRSLLMSLTTTLGPFHDFMWNFFALANVGGLRFGQDVEAARKNGLRSHARRSQRLDAIRERLGRFVKSNNQGSLFESTSPKIKSSRGGRAHKEEDTLSILRDRVNARAVKGRASHFSDIISREVFNMRRGSGSATAVLRASAGEEPSRLWFGILSDSSTTRAIGATLVDWLGLEPSAQWHEVIRLSIFPEIPRRLASMLSPALSDTTPTAKALAKPSASEFRTGFLILADFWMWSMGWYDAEDSSPYKALRDAAKHSRSAAIRLALLVDSAGRGDEEALAEITELLRDDKSSESHFLLQAYWSIQV